MRQGRVTQLHKPFSLTAESSEELKEVTVSNHWLNCEQWMSYLSVFQVLLHVAQGNGELI